MKGKRWCLIRTSDNVQLNTIFFAFKEAEEFIKVLSSITGHKYQIIPFIGVVNETVTQRTNSPA